MAEDAAAPSLGTVRLLTFVRGVCGETRLRTSHDAIDRDKDLDDVEVGSRRASW